MIDSREKKELVKRLHFIKGQLGGIEKMLDEDRPGKDVYGQLKAVEQALHQAIYVVLDDHLKKQFAEALAKRLDACLGNCDDAERLQFLKNEFAKLDAKEIIKEFTWLHSSLGSTQPNKSNTRRR